MINSLTYKLSRTYKIIRKPKKEGILSDIEYNDIIEFLRTPEKKKDDQLGCS